MYKKHAGTPFEHTTELMKSKFDDHSKLYSLFTNVNLVDNVIHQSQMRSLFVVVVAFFYILIAFLSFLFLYSFLFFLSVRKKKEKKKKNIIPRMKRDEVNEVCMCRNLNDYMRQHGLRKFK